MAEAIDVDAEHLLELGLHDRPIGGPPDNLRPLRADDDGDVHHPEGHVG